MSYSQTPSTPSGSTACPPLEFSTSETAAKWLDYTHGTTLDTRLNCATRRVGCAESGLDNVVSGLYGAQALCDQYPGEATTFTKNQHQTQVLRLLVKAINLNQEAEECKVGKVGQATLDFLEKVKNILADSCGDHHNSCSYNDKSYSSPAQRGAASSHIRVAEDAVDWIRTILIDNAEGKRTHTVAEVLEEIKTRSEAIESQRQSSGTSEAPAENSSDGQETPSIKSKSARLKALFTASR